MHVDSRLLHTTIRQAKIVTLNKINREYYTVTRRYEFYVRVARTIARTDIALATRT